MKDLNLKSFVLEEEIQRQKKEEEKFNKEVKILMALNIAIGILAVVMVGAMIWS